MDQSLGLKWTCGKEHNFRKVFHTFKSMEYLYDLALYN